MFLVRRPPPALAPFVDVLWWYEGEPALAPRKERILPTGRMQLLINLHEDAMWTYDADGRAIVARTGGATLSGAWARPFAIDTAEQRRIAGVGFLPGGAWPFLRAPAVALADADVELPELWGRDGAVVRERMLEAASPVAALDVLAAVLVEQVARPLAADPAVRRALAAFETGASVSAVVDELGLAQRTFLRRFSERVGMSPKRYACVRRFQRVLDGLEAAGGRARELDWARVAAELGYYDQAHLIHEFQGFAAMPPTAYRAAGPGARNHVPL